MKSEQSRVLLPAFNIKKSGARPEMINPQHARAEKNTERRLGFNLCKLGSSPDKVVPGFRQTGAKVVLMADSHIYRARIINAIRPRSEHELALPVHDAFSLNFFFSGCHFHNTFNSRIEMLTFQKPSAPGSAVPLLGMYLFKRICYGLYVCYL